MKIKMASIIISMGIAILAGLLAFIIQALFDLHGRVSRIEAKLDTLIDLHERVSSLESKLDTLLALGLRGINTENISGPEAIITSYEGKNVPKEKVKDILKEIDEPQALVNLAINKNVTIKDVILEGTGNEYNYNVKLTVTNITPKEIEVIVPKGQIFANKKVESDRQNLAAAKEYQITLGVGETKLVDIGSLCINKHLKRPDGGKGNVTIYKISGDFTDQDSLWKMISERLGIEDEHKESSKNN